MKETSTCPHPGCNQPVKLSDKQIQWFQAILDDMFKEYDSGDPDAGACQGIPHPLFASGILTITVLTGESMTIPYDPNMEVLQLKRQISNSMNHEVGKQKLLYNEKELIVSTTCICGLYRTHISIAYTIRCILETITISKGYRYSMQDVAICTPL